MGMPTIPKELHGIALGKIVKIAPKPTQSVQTVSGKAALVRDAKAVIQRHRKVLVALKNR